MVADGTKARPVDLTGNTCQLREVKEELGAGVTSEFDGFNKEDLSFCTELERIPLSCEHCVTDFRDKISNVHHDFRSEDLHDFRERLCRLRTYLAMGDHQNLLNMVDGMGSPSGKQRRQRHGGDEHRHDREQVLDCRHGRHSSSHSDSFGAGGGGGDLVNQATPVAGSDVTKVFCYMLGDKTEIPYVIVVPTK